MAKMIGGLTGFTAGFWAYMQVQKRGFNSFLPYARHKVGHYTIIFGAAYIFYRLGKRAVTEMTGDPE
jgi:hypothetical protein